MENKIKEHIDKSFKKRLKEIVDSELEKNKNGIDGAKDDKTIKQLKNTIKITVKEKIEKEYKYDAFLNNVLLQNQNFPYFPSRKDEKDLFQLLILEVLYKRTFKSACDDGHPIITELLEDLLLEKPVIEKCIEKAKSFNPEPLAFYLLFQEDIDNAGPCMDSICKIIDKLSEDSRYGAIVSHPTKMTNPDCKFPKFFASSDSCPDGFLRTGNSKMVFDMHINAVNLKVFKFVSLLYRKRTLLEYIRNKDHVVFEQLFGVSEEKAKTWIENFSECLNNEDRRTNQNIRQVYFPVEGNYHLLSLLTSSGLVFSLKEKIDTLNDRSPNAYSGKKLKKENKYAEAGYSSIPNLIMTRHGGEHPKNISGLNNKYQSYYLLSSTPPKLEKRNIHFPKWNFFTESFRYYEYRDVFDALHKLFKTDYNNVRIREGRDYRLQDLIDRIIDKMWRVRAVSEEQYRPKYTQLKPHQKIWLCHEYMQTREDENDWLDKLCKEIARWVIITYEKQLGKQAFKLGESERVHIFNIVTENREAFR
ncbi:type I-F CRISPR-associated protein Csy1 [candidate division CSSED10-310 bacterium]|uniref:Type I-F CRISPR-associated protein Csy1 n=1 Tax=candidate division CSSED10-310 bacterium TaxID=2855610 RepID=A0ABV6YZT0_UNCC1